MSQKKLVVASITAGLMALSTVAPAFANADQNPASDVDTQIIDGSRANSNPGAAVWIGSGRPLCTASVIAAQYILTAEHCVSGGSPSQYQVRVNSLNLNSGGEVIQVESWKTRYDIRVAKLVKPISNARPVQLASQDPPIGSVNQIYGWGSTAPGNNGSMSSVLKTANVKVDKMSQDYKKGPAIHSVATTGNAWKGDSGGPQFYNGQQVGVASTALTQTKSQNYSSVAQSLTFIKNAMNGGGGTQPNPNPRPNPQPNPRPNPQLPPNPRPNPQLPPNWPGRPGQQPGPQLPPNWPGRPGQQPRRPGLPPNWPGRPGNQPRPRIPGLPFSYSNGSVEFF